MGFLVVLCDMWGASGAECGVLVVYKQIHEGLKGLRLGFWLFFLMYGGALGADGRAFG